MKDAALDVSAALQAGWFYQPGEEAEAAAAWAAAAFERELPRPDVRERGRKKRRTSVLPQA